MMIIFNLQNAAKRRKKPGCAFAQPGLRPKPSTMYAYHNAPAERNSHRHCNDNLPRLSHEQRWALPYGAYFTWDGQTVLYNRRYRPIYRRWPDGHVERDDPKRWVHGIHRQCWFYADNCTRETLRRFLTIQRRWEAAAAGACIGLDQLVPAEWVLKRKVKKAA